VSEASGRAVVNAHRTPFLPYDLEGPVQPEMSWLPVSFDRKSGQGCYLMRTEPGAVTISHEHRGMEEFLVLEGGLVDSDGAVFTAGDFVSYAPGTTHDSFDGDGLLAGRLRVEAVRTDEKGRVVRGPFSKTPRLV
jgi:anti-sigma factor ChrR (cupin superfamily)